MHDLDRTYQEMEAESFQYEFETDGEWNEVLQEGELNELAAELLEVGNEQELDQFLGKFIKRVGGAVGGIIRSPLGKALGGVLKTVAKQALPMVGNMILPGAGGALASAAGHALGLELEGLSPEDREFEVAKQVVRLATDATRTALVAPEHANPAQVASTALQQAMQRHAPGLAPSRSGAPRVGGGQSGHWVRKGNRIIIYGV